MHMKYTKVWGAIISLWALLIYIAGRIANIWPKSDMVGVIVLLVAYGALQTLASIWAEQKDVTREFPRKLMHIGNGTVWTCLPWLFSNPWYPTFVGLSGIVWFLLLRSPAFQRRKELASAGNVYRSRSSVGDLFFSSAFALTFHLSLHDPVVYWAAAVVLTYGDALAALVGVCWGRFRFHTVTGFKSVEGAAACFIVTWVTILLALTAYETHALTLVVCSAVIALNIVLIELTTPWGIDNVLLPIATWGALSLEKILLLSTVGWIAFAISAVLILWLLILNFSARKARALLES